MSNENIETGLSYLFAEETLYDSLDENGEIVFEGGNRKKILLLFNNPLTDKISGTEKEILTRLLTASKSSIDEIAVVNIAFSNQVSFRQLHKQFRFDALTAFDVLPATIKLNIEIPLYQTIQLGASKLLFCESLIVIDKNKNTKLKFWDQFSPLFSVKK